MKTLKDRLVGLAALIAVVGIVFGAPLLLLTFPPFQNVSLAAVRSVLTHPDDGTVTLALAAVTGWVAWAYFTIAVVLEVLALVRNRPAPRLPGFSLPQDVARRLVAAAAMVFIAAPMSAGLAQASPGASPSPAPVAAAQQTAKPGPAKASTPAAGPQQGIRTHVVSAGDSLRSLAQQYLGDADRYDEIFNASRNTVQPDGQRLVDPDLIVDGWTLTIPTSTSKQAPAKSAAPTKAPASNHATAPATSMVPKAASKAVPASGATAAPARPAPAATHTTTTPQGKPAIQAPAATQVTGAAVPVPPLPVSVEAPAQSADTSATAEVLTSAEQGFPVRTATGVGAVVAAGVIALIATRRDRQQRRRRSGEAISMPSQQTMAVETQLRAVADPLAVEDVDCALRQLAAACAATSTPLPPVRAARLTADQFDLYLAEPATLPEPWYGTPDKTVWSLDATDRPVPLRRLREQTPSPYPSLVTIGHDLEDGHVLIDLEHLGALSVRAEGPEAEQNARAVLAALAVELGTSTWADDLQVSCVGGFAELEGALQTGSIRYVPTITVLLDQLERRAAQDREVLTAQTNGVGLAQARVTTVAADAWTPEIVLLCQPITPTEHDRLSRLVEDLPHIAIAVVSSHEPHMGDWTLTIPANGADHAVLEPLGLQLRAQQITEKDYSAILDSVSTATYDIPVEVMPSITTPSIATITPLAERSPFARPTEQKLALDEPAEESGSAVETTLDLPAVSTIPEGPLANLVKPASHAGTAEIEDDAEPTPAPADQDQDQPVESLEVTAEGPDRDESEHDAEILSIAEYARLRPGVEVIEPSATEWQHPFIRVLGAVRVDNAAGTAEPSKIRTWTEYATFLALNPDASVEAIDDAIWPNRKNADNGSTRRTATSKLRKWLGTNPETNDPYFPTFTYRLEGINTDWNIFQTLVPGAPREVSTQDLALALSLVRGRPFDGTAGDHAAGRKSSQYRYAWAEGLRQEMVAKIVDTAEELARRSLHQGRWGACEEAAALGIRMNPGVERLWRLRILAAYQAHDRKAMDEAIDRLYTIVEDDLGSELEEETTAFLAALESRSESFEKLEALL